MQALHYALLLGRFPEEGPPDLARAVRLGVQEAVKGMQDLRGRDAMEEQSRRDQCKLVIGYSRRCK